MKRLARVVLMAVCTGGFADAALSQLALIPGTDLCDSAYEDGFEDGRFIGFGEGRVVGFDEGFAEGFDEGRAVGFEEGFEEGITEGLNQFPEVCLEDPDNCGVFRTGYDLGQADCLADPASCNIGFSTLITLANRGETEPIDNPASADPLPPGDTLSGQTFDDSDFDWFWFSTPSPNAAITVTMKVPHLTSEGGWILSLRDRTGNTVAERNVYEGAPTEGLPSTTEDSVSVTWTSTVDDAGTYYLVVVPLPRGGIDLEGGDRAFSTASWLLNIQVTETGQDSPVLNGISFFDVETEANSSWDTADALASGVVIAGQLSDAGDEDWFAISSNGDEIISIDFCNSIFARFHNAFSEGCGAQWELWVIDGDVNKQVLDNGIDGDPDIGQFPINAIEFLADRGALGDSVLAHITATLFAGGQEANLDVGISDPGLYYFVIAPVWKREDGALERAVVQEEETEEVVIRPEQTLCPSGSQNVNGVCVVLPKECLGGTVSTDRMCNDADSILCPIGSTLVIVQQETTQIPGPGPNDPPTEVTSIWGYCEVEAITIPAIVEERVVVPEVLGGLTSDPFSTQQYTFTLRRTGLSPSTADSFANATAEMRASYDAESSMLRIPQLEIEDQLYEATLRFAPVGHQLNFRLEDIKPLP